jgi:hypothetical protein
LTILRETLTQYITFNRGGRGESVLCSLATVLSCIDPSVRIVTKSSQVGPLFSISLVYLGTGERRNILGLLVVVCRAGQVTLQESLLLLVILRGHKHITF